MSAATGLFRQHFLDNPSAEYNRYYKNDEEYNEQYLCNTSRPPAIPVNPSTAAIIAATRKTKAQLNILITSLYEIENYR